MSKKPNLDITEASLWESLDVWDDLTGAEGYVVFLFTRNTTPRPVVRIAKDRKSLSIKNNKTLTLSVSESPEVLRVDKSDIPNEIVERVSIWIQENKDLILRYWEERISGSKFFKLARETNNL